MNHEVLALRMASTGFAMALAELRKYDGKAVVRILRVVNSKKHSGSCTPKSKR